MSDFSVRVGERVKQCRMNAKMTQQEVSDKLNIIRQSYVNIEKGERPLKDEEISILADTFGTTADYLLNGTETGNIDICTVTGLSNDAVSFFTKGSNCENSLGEYLTIIDCLNCLLSTQQGNRVLATLGDYLECDYSTAYTNQTKDGLTFEPLDSSIGFEIKHKYISGRKTYHFLSPDLLEQSAQTLLIKQITELKEELQQPKPEQKKRVRKEKS